MIQFVREIPISISTDKTLPSRRGFLFYVAAGFAGEVDSESGMIVNLVVVDQWLQELKSYFERKLVPLDDNVPCLADFFLDAYQYSAAFLMKRAEDKGVTLATLSFREERGFGFGNFTVPVDLISGIEVYHTQFLELPLEGSTLYRVKLFWSHQQGQQADYATESFKLLKPLGALKAEDLMEQLGYLKGHKLISGSHLSRLEIQDIAQNLTLEL